MLKNAGRGGPEQHSARRERVIRRFTIRWPSTRWILTQGSCAWGSARRSLRAGTELATQSGQVACGCARPRMMRRCGALARRRNGWFNQQCVVQETA